MTINIPDDGKTFKADVLLIDGIGNAWRLQADVIITEGLWTTTGKSPIPGHKEPKPPIEWIIPFLTTGLGNLLTRDLYSMGKGSKFLKINLSDKEKT